MPIALVKRNDAHAFARGLRDSHYIQQLTMTGPPENHSIRHFFIEQPQVRALPYLTNFRSMGDTSCQCLV